MGLKDITRAPFLRFWMLLASRTIMESSKSKEATYTTPASFLRARIVRESTAGWRPAYVACKNIHHFTSPTPYRNKPNRGRSP